MKAKRAMSKKLILILLVMFVALPLLIWLLMPMFTSLTIENVSAAKQTVNGLAVPLFFVRMGVYALMVLFMPMLAGVHRDRMGQARRAMVLLLIAVEVVLVQRLWLF